MNTYIKETLKNSIPDKIENAQPAQVHKHEIKVNVKEMREKIGCSRSEFSQRYGIARDTLKKWELELRTPEGPALILLKLIEARPKEVADLLQAQRENENSSAKLSSTM